MKLVIEIPEKTNAHIRSDYGHGTKGLRDEDREILCDAIYHGTPYEERPHGKWVQVTDNDGEYLYHKCSNCGQKVESGLDNPPFFNFCMDCGSDNRKRGEKNV